MNGINTIKINAFISNGSKAKEGVAILVNPHSSQTFTPSLLSSWSPRFISVTTMIENTQLLIIYIYAPNGIKERKSFFHQLASLQLPKHDILLLGGDFNSVENEITDRVRKVMVQSRDSSVQAFNELKCKWNLIDTSTIIRSDNKYVELSTHTFLGPHGSAKLDRIYISHSKINWVLDHHIQTPEVASDHRQVWLTLINPLQMQEKTKHTPKYYPHPWMRNQGMKITFHAELSVIINDNTQECIDNIQEWDKVKLEILDLLFEYKKSYTQAKTSLLAEEKEQIKRKKAYAMKIKDVPQLLTLENQFTDIKKQIATLKKRSKFYHYYNDSDKGFQRLFQRLNAKNYRSTIPNLLGENESNANKMATGWVPLLKAKAQTRRQRRDKENKIKSLKWEPLTKQQFNSVDGKITEEEVKLAIKQLKKNKTPGVDNLPNDFYIDFEDILVPILVKIFNVVKETGEIFNSATDTSILPIPKKNMSIQPLDYRPISLLNSDYKLFTRIIANRVKKILPGIINEDQAGFVPKRRIEETIDKMRVGVELLKKKENDQAGVLMVDFAKAFDSIDRNAIFTVLTCLKFPDWLIDIVKRTHHQTKVRYNVNGFLSRQIEAERGIRQGCPLAPILFILIMEIFNKLCEENQNQMGLTTKIENTQLNLSAIGFVDDLTLFFKNEKELHLYLNKLEIFNKLTDLKIQPTKSLIISPALQIHKTIHGIPIQQVGETARFLGIAINSNISESTAWNCFFPKILSKVHLMSKKTSTINQRVVATKSIIQAQIRYCATHYFPPKQIIKKLENLQKNYVWNNMASDQPLARNRIHKQWLQSASKKGGLGLPCLRKILDKLTAQRVNRWD